jgi:hypothetical protein
MLMLIVLSACKRSDLEAKIPAYLSIPDFDLETNYTTEGSAHSKFTTAWVFYNNEAIGAFEVPCTIPIIPVEGEASLLIYPGVSMNGIDATRSIYVPCAPYESNVTLTELDTFYANPQTTLNPNTQYYDAATVIIVEDFDGSGINLEPTTGSDTSVIIVNDPANTFDFPGEDNGNSGLLTVTNDSAKVEIKSSDSYTLPRGKDVYVEMTYKSNNSLVVGVIANETVAVARSTVLLKSTDNEWNKIYINLIGEIGLSNQGTSFNLLMGTLKDDGVDTAKIYLDNLKLVYR